MHSTRAILRQELFTWSYDHRCRQSYVPPHWQFMRASMHWPLRPTNTFNELKRTIKAVEVARKLNMNMARIANAVQCHSFLPGTYFLITLIKCLKGHKCLGCLCVTQSLTEWVTESRIELYSDCVWAAKRLKSSLQIYECLLQLLSHVRLYIKRVL